MGVQVLGILVRDDSWFHPIAPGSSLPPGTVVKEPLQIPAAVATRLLQSTVLRVAEVPTDAPPVVVWQSGGSELLVALDKVAVSCMPGMMTVSMTVSCDELPAPVVVNVPFAVGTPDAPAGLIMSTFAEIVGPDVIARRWSDAVISFAWSAVVDLAEQLCASLGTDSRGLALVPGAVGASRAVLVVQAMARHQLPSAVLT